MAYAPVLETLAPLQGGTPDDVERYRKLAEALMEQAGSGEPVEHWMEGVGRLAQALSGTLNERKAGAIQREGEARGWEYLEGQASQGGGYGGGTSGGETADVSGSEPVAATGDDADMIIRTVIGEAAGEGPVGQQAVAAVILNRARQSGKSPTEVVLAKNQFEPWGSRASQLRAIDPNSEQYRRVAAAVLPVLQGQARDPTGGATHFYAPKAQAALGRSTPSWARGQGQDIGNHRFYSLGYGGGGRHGIPAGETADIPGAEPVSTAPSPEVMRHITGGGATPAGMAFASPPASPPAPLASVPPPAPIMGQDAPVAGPPMPPVAPPPLAARVPQPRPAPPVAPAAPATTGTVTAPAQARPVPMPPVKNDYNAIPGRPPAAMPMKPGQLMQEPYSGPMSAQEFARQGQAAMRARAAGQQPTGLAQALTPGGQPPQQPPQPRRNLIQALFGRGGTGQPAAAQPAPAGSAAPAGGNRGRLQAAMSDLAFLPPAAQAMALKRLFPEPGEGFTLGDTRFDAQGNIIASVPEEPPEQPSAVREYEFAKSQGFPGTFQDWEASKKGGMSLQVDPETGAVIFQQGGNIRPMTEAQSKDTVYATRAEGSLATLDEMGNALTSFGESAAGSLGTAGNYLKSEEYQQAEQAGREFLAAVLRKDTGAAVTEQEMGIYGSTYLPEPGNGPKVLEQKRVSRRRALEGLKAGMTPQAILAQENALRRTEAAAGTAAPATAQSDLPEGVTEEDIKFTMEKHGLTREQVLEKLR